MASPPSAVAVCVIISSFRPVLGGAELVTERLCRELVRRGLNVVVLTRRYPGLSAVDNVSGVPIRRLGHPSRSKAGALTFGLHALWLLATHLHRYRVVHVQNTDTPLLIGFFAKLFLRRRLLATMQSDPRVLLGTTRTTGRSRLRLLRYLADAVGAQSPEMQRHLVEDGLPPSRIFLLPNAVDTERFRPPTDDGRRRARSDLGLPDDAIVVLFVGRLVAVKRIDLLLRAWARSFADEPYLLLVLGAGPQGEELEALSAELGLRNVRFELATEDVLPYLHASDIFVLPSQREGLSNALLEAMAAGLAVLVTDIPGNRAVVRDGVTGLTFPVDDLPALTTRLRELESSRLRRRLGEQASRAASAYSIDVVAGLHEALYERVSRKPERVSLP